MIFPRTIKTCGSQKSSGVSLKREEATFLVSFFSHTPVKNDMINKNDFFTVQTSFKWISAIVIFNILHEMTMLNDIQLNMRMLIGAVKVKQKRLEKTDKIQKNMW